MIGPTDREGVFQNFHHTIGFLCYVSFSIPFSHHEFLGAFATRICQNKAKSCAMCAVCEHVLLFTRETAESFFFCYRREFVYELKFRL